VSKRFATLMAGLALGQSLVLTVSPAKAGNDREALELAEKALYEDYLNLEFKAAEKKLTKAIRLCESDCNPTNLARVYRDMGVLQIAGLQDRGAGIEMFQKALGTDPSVDLDADLSTPDIDSAWQEAQASAGSGNSALSAAMHGSVDPEDDEPPPEEQDPMLRAMEEEEKKRASEEVEEQPALREEPEPEPERRAPIDFKLDDEDCPPDFPGCDTSGDSSDETPEDYPQHWLHVGYQVDFLLMDASTQACAGDTYQCYYSGGTYREPQPGVPLGDGRFGGEGTISSGLVMATHRILVGYDYAVIPSILLGIRGGFAFLGGGPQKNSAVTGQGKAFFPVHAEVRGAYWFGGADNGGLRPYLQLSGGLAQVDGQVSVPIADRARLADCTNQSRSQDPDCFAQPVDAWKKAGTGFVSAGLGALIAVGDNHGLLIEGRAVQLLGAAGLAAAVQAGYSVGL